MTPPVLQESAVWFLHTAKTMNEKSIFMCFEVYFSD
jgi:hypothetical protein